MVFSIRVGELRSKCSLGTSRDLEAEAETEGSRRKTEEKRKMRPRVEKPG